MWALCGHSFKLDIYIQVVHGMAWPVFKTQTPNKKTHVITRLDYVLKIHQKTPF
jgi:hypothetical protein